MEPSNPPKSGLVAINKGSKGPLQKLRGLKSDASRGTSSPPSSPSQSQDSPSRLMESSLSPAFSNDQNSPYSNLGSRSRGLSSSAVSTASSDQTIVAPNQPLPYNHTNMDGPPILERTVDMAYHRPEMIPNHFDKYLSAWQDNYNLDDDLSQQDFVPFYDEQQKASYFKLPPAIRERILSYTLPYYHSMQALITLSPSSAEGGLYPKEYFALPWEILHAVEGALYSCKKMRDEIMTKFWTHYRFHVILSAYTAPDTWPMTMKLLPIYLSKIQSLTVEIDYTKWGGNIVPNSHLIESVGESTIAEIGCKIFKSIAARKQKFPAQSAVLYPPGSPEPTIMYLHLKVRRYAGTRMVPNVDGRLVEKLICPESALHVFDQILPRYLQGMIIQFRMSGFSAGHSNWLTSRLLSILAVPMRRYFVAWPNPETAGVVHTMLYPYKPTGEGSLGPMKKYDQVLAFDNKKGWTRVEDLKRNKGFVPTKYIRKTQQIAIRPEWAERNARPEYPGPIYGHRRALPIDRQIPIRGGWEPQGGAPSKVKTVKGKSSANTKSKVAETPNLEMTPSDLSVQSPGTSMSMSSQHTSADSNYFTGGLFRTNSESPERPRFGASVFDANDGVLTPDLRDHPFFKALGSASNTLQMTPTSDATSQSPSMVNAQRKVTAPGVIAPIPVRPTLGSSTSGMDRGMTDSPTERPLSPHTLNQQNKADPAYMAAVNALSSLSTKNKTGDDNDDDDEEEDHDGKKNGNSGKNKKKKKSKGKGRKKW